MKLANAETEELLDEGLEALPELPPPVDEDDPPPAEEEPLPPPQAESAISRIEETSIRRKNIF
jgi:hypothetical protein